MNRGPGAGSGHWFEEVAEHLGEAYLRYSFTYGTVQEVDFLVEALALEGGARILDVGCGPGRHSHELARRGFEVVGVDISQAFIDLANAAVPSGATFVRADARDMGYTAEFDAAISLCQGAFGLAGGPGAETTLRDPDEAILERIAASVRPGGRLALSAFSAYFQVRFMGELDEFDADSGVNHEQTEIRDPAGTVHGAELWTSCFTPREIRLLADRAGLAVEGLWSVAPGDYGRRPPDIEHPEFFLLAAQPG